MKSMHAPNHELAIQLLAGGCDERELRRHAGFESLRQARMFMGEIETQRAVSELVANRCRRVGALAVRKLDAMLNDDTLDGRTAIAAARTGLEVSGLLRKDGLPPSSKPVTELSGAELNEMIEETKAQLERQKRKRAIN